TATATGTAVVTPPPLQATPRNFAVNKGVPFNGAVATFTDPDPRTDPSKYTATITWDDNTTSTGRVSGTNPFTVTPLTAHVFSACAATPTISGTTSAAAGGRARTVMVPARIVDPPAENPNGPFVYQLYQDLLQRPADDAGLASWTALLDRGASRAQVAAGILG